MKVIKTTEVVIELTPEDVRKALVDYLPERFAGKVFAIGINTDRSATLTMDKEVS